MLFVCVYVCVAYLESDGRFHKTIKDAKGGGVGWGYGETGQMTCG
jgi:hypothetical protein